MDNKMNKPVDVICYGTREHFETRQEALNKYIEAMNACEGSEQERYAKIHYALVHGSADLVTDGSSERVESEPLVKFTADDKDKIINFIIADVLSINSPEIYDRGACKLVVEDRDIIKALLKKDGWYAAQFLRNYIENDKELILAVAEGGEARGKALCYASEKLQDDKEFVLELIKIDASDVRYVSDRLSNDPEIISAALKSAETDYDINSIKEVLGKELLAEMVQAHFEKQQEKISENEIKFEAIKEFENSVARRLNCNTPRGAYLINLMHEVKREMDMGKTSLAEKIAEAEKVADEKANSKLFDVTITETLKMTVQVEAEDLLDAEQMVSESWHNQEYILDADNFTGVEFEAKAVKEKTRSFDDRDER